MNLPNPSKENVSVVNFVFQLRRVDLEKRLELHQSLHDLPISKVL